MGLRSLGFMRENSLQTLLAQARLRHLGGELGAALLLELRQDGALVVLGAGLLHQQPPRQPLAVELCKQVLQAQQADRSLDN